MTENVMSYLISYQLWHVSWAELSPLLFLVWKCVDCEPLLGVWTVSQSRHQTAKVRWAAHTQYFTTALITVSLALKHVPGDSQIKLPHHKTTYEISVNTTKRRPITPIIIHHTFQSIKNINNLKRHSSQGRDFLKCHLMLEEVTDQDASLQNTQPTITSYLPQSKSHQ